MDEKYSRKSRFTSLKIPIFKFSTGLLIFFIFIFFYEKKNVFYLKKKLNPTIIKKKSEIDLKTNSRFNKTGFSKKMSEVVTVKNKESDNFKQLEKVKILIPDYKILKLVEGLDSFDQGKIYVGINKDTKIEAKDALCRYLVPKYSNFKNIIICLFSNDDTGIKLASQKEITLLNKKQKDSWLGMYTFNDIEGHYFDPNPSENF